MRNYLFFISTSPSMNFERIIFTIAMIRFKNASLAKIIAPRLGHGKCSKTFRNYLAGRNYPSNCRRDRRRLICRVAGLIFTRRVNPATKIPINRLSPTSPPALLQASGKPEQELLRVTRTPCVLFINSQIFNACLYADSNFEEKFPAYSNRFWLLELNLSSIEYYLRAPRLTHKVE